MLRERSTQTFWSVYVRLEGDVEKDIQPVERRFRFSTKQEAEECYERARAAGLTVRPLERVKRFPAASVSA